MPLQHPPEQRNYRYCPIIVCTSIKVHFEIEVTVASFQISRKMKFISDALLLRIVIDSKVIIGIRFNLHSIDLPSSSNPDLLTSVARTSLCLKALRPYE